MDAFSKLNAKVIFLYYLLSFFLLLWFGHPLISAIVWLFSSILFVCMQGIKSMLRMLVYSAFGAVLCLIINPLLNRRGVTVLFTVGDWHITKESVLYGGNMALLLLASHMLFACMSLYMTSEKIMEIGGRRFPVFTLLFSMLLGFIPRAKRDFHEMVYLHGNRPAVWSALLGFTMEGAMERSISMKSREYGRRKRTSYHQQSMKARDYILLFVMIFLLGICFVVHPGTLSVRFFPSIHIESVPIAIGMTLTIFYSIPLLGKGKENLSWLLSQQKITNLPIPDKKEKH